MSELEEQHQKEIADLHQIISQLETDKMEVQAYIQNVNKFYQGSEENSPEKGVNTSGRYPYNYALMASPMKSNYSEQP